MSATFDGLWSIDRDQHPHHQHNNNIARHGKHQQGSKHGVVNPGSPATLPLTTTHHHTASGSYHGKDNNLRNGIIERSEESRMSSYYHSGGTHTNPAYQGTAEKQRNEPVILSMNGGGYEDHPKWSWCSTGWSCFTTFCCASLCGWMGMLMSILSYTDHKSGDYERSRYKRRWAWCCSMTGLVISLLFITAILVVVFVFYAQVAAALCPLYAGAGQADPWAAFCANRPKA